MITILQTITQRYPCRGEACYAPREYRWRTNGICYERIKRGESLLANGVQTLVWIRRGHTFPTKKTSAQDGNGRGISLPSGDHFVGAQRAAPPRAAKPHGETLHATSLQTDQNSLHLKGEHAIDDARLKSGLPRRGVACNTPRAASSQLYPHATAEHAPLFPNEYARTAPNLTTRRGMTFYATRAASPNAIPTRSAA